ncbi:MAG: ECF-type sigma factor [Phycisphaerales bacterium]
MDLGAEVYAELRTLAASCLRRERRDHTHQPTSLANEAYLRLGPRAREMERGELIGLASRAMRQVLVDHARRRVAQKRGSGGSRVALEPDTAIDRRAPEDLLAVDDALARLAAIDPALAELIELRYFGGLGEADAAEHLGVSLRTVSRRWRIAKMCLARELGWARP